MDWFDKHSPVQQYIREVKGYLPRRMRDDIGEELSNHFEEKLEAMKKRAKRAPSEEAVLKMLSKHGHPLRVAASYQGDSRSLIGPDVYPFYRTAILAALGISTAIMLTLAALDFVFAFGLGDVSRVWMFVNTYIYIVGIITMAFVVSERLMQKYDYLESWSPEGMNAPDNPVGTAWGALFSVFAAVTWLVILNMVDMEYSLAVLSGVAGNPFHTLVLWMQIQLLLLIPQYITLVVNQTWSYGRLVLRLATEGVLLTGCVVTLTMDEASFRSTYAELPESLFLVFDLVVWALIVATLISMTLRWRSAMRALRSDAPAVSSDPDEAASPSAEEATSSDNAAAAAEDEQSGGAPMGESRGGNKIKGWLSKLRIGKWRSATSTTVVASEDGEKLESELAGSAEPASGGPVETNPAKDAPGDDEPTEKDDPLAGTAEKDAAAKASKAISSREDAEEQARSDEVEAKQTGADEQDADPAVEAQEAEANEAISSEETEKDEMEIAESESDKSDAAAQALDAGVLTDEPASGSNWEIVDSAGTDGKHPAEEGVSDTVAGDDGAVAPATAEDAPAAAAASEESARDSAEGAGGDHEMQSASSASAAEIPGEETPGDDDSADDAAEGASADDEADESGNADGGPEAEKDGKN